MFFVDVAPLKKDWAALLHTIVPSSRCAKHHNNTKHIEETHEWFSPKVNHVRNTATTNLKFPTVVSIVFPAYAQVKPAHTASAPVEFRSLPASNSSWCQICHAVRLNKGSPGPVANYESTRGRNFECRRFG